MAIDAFRIKSVYRAFSILAALSISISTNSGALAYQTPEYIGASERSDNLLIARFPFRKPKESNADSDENSDKAPSDSSKGSADSNKDSSDSSKTSSDSNKDSSDASKTSSDAGKGSADSDRSNSGATSNSTNTDESATKTESSAESKPSKSNALKQSGKQSKGKQKDEKKNEKESKKKKAEGKEQEDAEENKKKDADKSKKKKSKENEKSEAKPAKQKSKEVEKQSSDESTRDQNKSSTSDDKPHPAEKATTAAEQAKKNKELSKRAAEEAKRDNEQSEKFAEQSANQNIPPVTKPGKTKAKAASKNVTRFAPANATVNPTAALAATGAYQADAALMSLLNDLARALKDPAEQAKFGDDNQKMVVGMAADVLNKALEHKNNANRIVDKQSSGGAAMNAEAWSSGDVKVSDECRGSLAVVWAKRENGLVNVTIAGTCRDKTAPNGKKVGEYVVVLSARSTIQKGFDIQSQADVRFWLAKLASVSVDADCCASPDSNATTSGEAPTEQTNATSVNSETKVLQQHALVVLQTVITERQRSTAGFVIGSTAGGAIANASDESVRKATLQNSEVEQTAESTKDEAERNAKSVKEEVERNAKAAKDAAEREAKIAKEKSARKTNELADRRANEEAVRKANDANKEAARKAKAEYEEDQRKAEKERQNEERKAAKEKEALEKQAQKEREKEDERLASEDQRRQHAQEKLAARAEKDAQDDFAVRDEYSARRDARYTNREDMILEEATRQVEAERSAGIDTRRSYPSERMTSENMRLAEANRQAEDARREAADMRAPHADERMTRDDMILAEATREAEAERREANLRNTEAPQQVDIGDSKASLRPTLLSSGKSTEVAPAPLIADAETNNSQTGYGWEMRPNAKQKPSRWAGAEADEPSNEPATAAAAPPQQIASKPSEVVLKKLENSKLVLPQRCIAGQYITAAVIDSKNEGQDGIELNFNGTNYTTDEHGQVAFMVPDDTASGATMHVGMSDYHAGKHTSIEVLQPLSTSAEQNTPTIEKISHKVSSPSGTIILDGHNFDGIAHRNRITIDDLNDAEVLAASPVQIKAAIPTDLKPGKHTAAIDIGVAKSNSAEFELLTTEIVSDPRDPNGKLIVRVLGTTNKVSVHVLNKTPEVIKITKGNDLRATTTGGDNNNLVLPMLRLRKGSYRVNATVD